MDYIGTVIPARQTARMLGGRSKVQTVTVLGSTSRRTTEALQIEQLRQMRKATGDFA